MIKLSSTETTANTMMKLIAEPWGFLISTTTSPPLKTQTANDSTPSPKTFTINHSHPQLTPPPSSSCCICHSCCTYPLSRAIHEAEPSALSTSPAQLSLLKNPLLDPPSECEDANIKDLFLPIRGVQGARISLLMKIKNFAQDSAQTLSTLWYESQGTHLSFIMPSHHLEFNVYDIVIFTMPLPQQSSFVSPLSRLGFGILNTNESMHESPTFMSSPQQLLYANECHYQQPHQYQTPGDYEVYSQKHNDQDMTLFDSNQDGHDNSTISYVNENLAFRNVAQIQSVTMPGGSQEINSFIATPVQPQQDSTSPKLPSASAKRIQRTKQQLANAATGGAKKKSGKANKHKNATKDQNAGFVRLDYENICSYLEDWDH
ncbi:hypothetical protein O181_020820 [Austropuccinia psidii MF-1]|uniref:Uncharacterized protein n=1 Tax=Austropuccinia psidii MF-1 TaxID=1389203 RepID=A0A9Q3GWG9_9BASI|nr:hypothetical protein [Austropuccinia psidii MF-1]